MNIIMPLHSCWSHKILDGSKPFEFRNRLLKDFGIGDIVYIYEAGHQGGCKMVVGEFTVKNIIKLTDDEGRYPVYGCYYFIDWYLHNIAKEPYAAEQFKLCKDIKLANYKLGSILPFAMNPDAMEPIKHGSYPPPLSKDTTDEQVNKWIDNCDSWLYSIGFYDNCLESYWKYAIEVEGAETYKEPRPLSSFANRSGESITYVPQSMIYGSISPF